MECFVDSGGGDADDTTLAFVAEVGDPGECLLHTGIGKSHCVDQGLFRLEGYEARFGVTNARFGGDGSNSCESESDSEHFAYKKDLLVQSGSQADRAGHGHPGKGGFQELFGGVEWRDPVPVEPTHRLDRDLMLLVSVQQCTHYGLDYAMV